MDESQVTLTKPQHIISLRSSMILVSVDTKVWTATKQDKESSAELTHAKKADDNAARVTQNLLVGNAKHKALLNYRQTIYNWLKRETYPWNDSQGALPAVNIVRFMEQFKGHEAAFYQLRSEFVAEYPSIVNDIAFKMGDFFNRRNYPTPEEVETKFSVRLFTSEIPEGDFRNVLAHELADDLHKTYERQTQEIVGEIVSKQAEQLIGVMESISHTCEVEVSTDTDGKTKVKRRRLYDSTIQRALDLCNSFQSFNICNDAKLEEARFRLQKILSRMDVNTLRESDGLRTAVKSEVDDILARFKSPI